MPKVPEQPTPPHGLPFILLVSLAIVSIVGLLFAGFDMFSASLPGIVLVAIYGKWPWKFPPGL